MNAELFQEKMDPTHRMYLCRMLGIKETALLPEDLLERYAQVKRLVDRIDGHLTPGDLAMIIMSVGNNPEIATELLGTTEGEDARLQAQADEMAVDRALDESDDKVIEEAVQPPVQPPIEQPAEPAETAPPTAAEQPVEPPVSGATGQAAEKPTPDKGKAMLWSPGMPVRALHEDELKHGRIVGISRPSEVAKQVGAAVKLTVEIEGGETITVEEDEVEAV